MFFFLSAISNPDEPKPPRATPLRKTTELHGETLIDDYAWLRDKTNPETMAYLNAENAYAAAFLQPQKHLEESLYNEMLAHIKETDMSAPTKHGDFFYYTRTEKDKSYTIYCRKHLSLQAPEEILLDENQLAEGKAYCALGLIQVSDDHNLLAFAVDETGYRQFKLFFKNLKTGELLADDVGFINSFQWCADHQTFFYTVEDEAKRPYRLYRRRLGASAGELVYEERDALYGVAVSRSRDKAFIFLTIASKTTHEVRFVSSQSPASPFQVVALRENEHKYSVEHRDGVFYILTNKNAKNYRVVTAPVASPSMANWREFIAHRETAVIESLDIFLTYFVLTIQERGLTQYEIRQFDSDSLRRITFSEPTYFTFSQSNPEFEATQFRYGYESLVTPFSIYDFDVQTNESVLLKRKEVLGDFDSGNYRSERLFAKAKDGAEIPISIVYRNTFKRDGTEPLLLYGYGSYGISMPASFSVPRLALLDRGVAFAIAHIRGGSEFGEPWHDAGKMMKKMNTFTDFIACAEFLFEQNYTAPNRLAIEGGSAGGLLIGAVLNLRPDICKVAHLAVPFVDVINTMLDETLPLTVGEFLEWGNPKNEADFKYMRGYSPYDNLAATEYPNILITTSLNDSQVGFWEPAKYAAKLRALKRDSNFLILKTNMDAGHSGASGRYDYLKEIAFEYGVILTALKS